MLDFTNAAEEVVEAFEPYYEATTLADVTDPNIVYEPWPNPKTSMSQRRQLPPQIKKIEVTDRTSGKPVVRYQVTVDSGNDPETGRRRQVRRRFTTEKSARAELAPIRGGVSAGTYVHTNKLTVDQACEAWLASEHSLKPSTLRGHRVSLQPARDELGTIEVQKLTKAHLDALVGRMRRGEVEGAGSGPPGHATTCCICAQLFSATE